MVEVRQMIWMTSMWVQQYGVYLCLSHFKLQFTLDKIIRKTYDLARIDLCNLWNNYFRQLKSWSKIKWRSQVCPRLNGTSLCGEKHLYCVVELFILWNPKPTSLLTQCCVWEVSVLYQTKLGKTKLNGIWENPTSKMWIESTESRWNSSGKNFPGFTASTILAEMQKMMAELRCEPEQFQGRIIFMSMYNVIVCGERGNRELYCECCQCSSIR